MDLDCAIGLVRGLQRAQSHSCEHSVIQGWNPDHRGLSTLRKPQAPGWRGTNRWG